MKLLNLTVWVVLAGMVGGCSFLRDTSPVDENVSLMMEVFYERDLVEITLDDQLVFSDTVTTNYVLGLAKSIDIPVSEGMHKLHVRVNQEVEADTTFMAKDPDGIAIRYEPDREHVTFVFRRGMIIYD